jgi:hypothetical protein
VASSIPEISGKQKLSFLRAEYDPREISDVYPSTPQTITTGSRFTMAGKLLQDQGKLTIHYGFGSTVVKR